MRKQITISKKKPMNREAEVRDGRENIMAYGTLVLEAYYSLVFHVG